MDRTKSPIFETVAKGDSNSGSLDCESGILPLSYRAPYVKRRDDDYAGKEMPKRRLPGKRKRGRPKRGYLEVVKEDMQEIGVKF